MKYCSRTDAVHDHIGLDHAIDPSGMNHTEVLGGHADVPWLIFGPHAMHNDIDHDGIRDALDHAVGPGADHGILGTHADVPWLNFGPHAATHDADNDGIPDAVDHHVGPAAHDLSPGAFSSGVPWQQITPDAMNNDTDADGIPDALDNRLGPGA